MLDVALAYAAMGWPVFPVSNSKRPFKGSRGLKDASTDPTRVRELWNLYGVNAQVALATGRIVVLDADGDGGMVLLRDLALACGGKLPKTLQARTPRGGLHVYYLAPDGVTVRTYASPRAVKGGDGLDIKAAGGYVVLPPSAGRTWVDQSVQIATLTPEMLHAISALRAKGKKLLQGKNDSPTDPKNDPLGFLASGPSRPLNTRSQSVGPSLAQRGLRAQHKVDYSPHEFERIRSALKAIDQTKLGYQEWLDIGFALHSLEWETADGDLGQALWDEFSARSPHYNAAKLEQKWASFGNYTGNRITIATVIAYAQESGWRGEITTVDVRSSPNGENGENRGNGVFNGKVNGHALAPAAFPDALSAQGAIFVDTDKAGNARGTCVNTRVALRALGLTCRYDTFHEKLIVGGHVIEQWAGELSDNAVHVLKGMIRQKFGFEPNRDTMYDSVVQECLAHAYHPIKDYLDTLEWDGVPRIETWLIKYLGAADEPLTRAIGKLTLIAAVRRVEEPGCKFDQIIVFEGPQGKGKSSALEILAGVENHSDQQVLTLDDRAQQEAIRGVWLFEIGELAGIYKADLERVNTFASRRFDRARPAYGRIRVDRPRQCILFGTTNDGQYLRRQTGNRRFWPVAAGTIDLEGLRRDRDQLWAEAATLEAQGHSIVLPEELWPVATAQQDARMVDDPWFEALATVAPKETFEMSEDRSRREFRVSGHSLLTMTLGITMDRATDSATKRLKYCMNRLGWQGPTVKWVDGKPVRVYTKPAD